MKKRVAIYNPYLETRGGGEKLSLAIAEYLSSNYEVTLISKSKNNLSKLEEYFSLDLSKCKLTIIDNKSKFFSRLSARLHFPRRLNSLIGEYYDYKKIKKANYDLFINVCYRSNIFPPSKKSIYLCMFPQEFNHNKDSLHRKIYHKLVDVLEKILYGKAGVNVVRSYTAVVAISSYTKSWIEKYWGIDGDDIPLLYPICENMKNSSIKKEKLILNVGRFFSNSGENHHKCQDKLLEAFREMGELQKSGWRLCFIGSVAEDTDSLRYFLKLYQDSRDLPVEIITNTPFSVLKDHFAKASIYWHATGAGYKELNHPEKQEHFGITTIEAMTAGAVPVVINSAGQKETVIDGEDGFLWNNKKELIDLTYKVANNPELFNKMSKMAEEDAKRFNKESFEKSLSNIIKNLYP